MRASQNTQILNWAFDKRKDVTRHGGGRRVSQEGELQGSRHRGKIFTEHRGA